MGPCEHNADRWLDHLYGLLPEGESRELAEHVTHCPVCQASLAEAERDRRRMARASLWFRDVAEFRVPDEELKPVASPQIAAISVTANGAAPPATVPIGTQRRRSLARRLAPMWAAAAAVLAMTLGGMALYQHGADKRDQAVADAKKQWLDVDAQHVALRRQADTERTTLLKQIKAETLCLFAIGATRAHPDAPYACRIATRNLDGQPVPSDLEVRWVRAGTGEVLQRQALASDGDVEVLMPPGGKLDKELRLEVAARHGASSAELRETVPVATGAPLIHLAVSKAVAQHGEVVFFRALAVDRFSLKPLASAQPLRFALMDSRGKALLELKTTTDAHGSASGEFALVDAIPPGVYHITVATADSKTPLHSSHSRGLEVVERLSDFNIQLERKTYRPGETVVIHLSNVRGLDGQPLANALVSAGTDIKGPSGVKFSMGAKAVTDPQGKAKITFPIPTNFDGSRFNVHIDVPALRNGKKQSKIVRTISVAPSRFVVDFYPEGGDLVAGVPQRVFFRVRTPQGEAAAFDGSFRLLSDAGVVFASKAKENIGHFMMTPDAKAAYTLEVVQGALVNQVKNPFASTKVALKTEGLALQVTNSVAAEGEPLRLELRRTGSSKELFALASSRGQIVGQRFVDPNAASLEMTLPTGVRGIVRLTIYGVQDQRLTPLAERLVYRAPARRLDIQAAVNALRPGQGAAVEIKAFDELGKPAAAGALALVVDDRYRGERQERSLAGHFLLASEFAAELADAPLLVDDTPESRQVLELFLGTHGWRHFVAPTDETPQFAQGQEGPTLFVAENSDQVRVQWAARVQNSMAALQHRLERERVALNERREQLAAALTSASDARAAYRRLPNDYFRLGLGLLAAIALVVGGLCLVVGLARSLRRRSATAAFAGAFAAMALCLTLYVTAGSFPLDGPNVPGDRQPLARGPFPPIEFQGLKDGIKLPRGPLAGQIALAESTPAGTAVTRPQLDLVGAMAMFGGDEQPGEVIAPKFIQNPRMQERFKTAQTQQTSGVINPELTREFAHRNQPGFDAAMTLAWHPKLAFVHGQATMEFDVPRAPSSYRLLLWAHDAEGRLGFLERRFSSQQSP